MAKTKKEKHVRLKSTSKSRLRDFNIEEARGWTIDRLQQIENRINEKIIVTVQYPINEQDRKVFPSMH